VDKDEDQEVYSPPEEEEEEYEQEAGKVANERPVNHRQRRRGFMLLFWA